MYKNEINTVLLPPPLDVTDFEFYNAKHRIHAVYQRLAAFRHVKFEFSLL